MATEKQHEIKDVSVLSIVYLRNALNNPQWASGLDDWINGCDALRAIPLLAIPKGLTTDEEVLGWGTAKVDLSITDKVRDSCRAALKKAFDSKSLPINQHSAALIHHFSLK